MYRININSWDLYLKSQSHKLPDGEFILCKNSNWETIYVNRNQILYYTVTKIGDDLSNKKEEWKQ
jgi:hypothetical protein